jgi:hypothetical protein
MIHWGWVIAAFVTGTWFGIIIEGLLAAKGAQDRCDECYWKRLASELRDAEMATLATEEKSDG